MVRVKRGNVARNRRKKILKFAKGFKGAHSRLFRTANGQVMKALVYSYVGRKRRKQDFKKLWICRVNAAARSEGTNYSKLRNSLKKSSIKIIVATTIGIRFKYSKICIIYSKANDKKSLSLK